MPVRGWDSVSVPGCVAAWVELHAKFGKLPFEKLFEPAIRYGREGFMVSPTIARQWAAQVAGAEGAARLRRGLHAGRARRRASARCSSVPTTPRRWRKSPPRRGEAFYRGELAEKIEAHAKTARRGDARVGPRRAQVRLGRHAAAGLPRLHASTRSRPTARASSR